MEKELDEAYSQIQQQKKLIKELKDQAKENNIELTKAYNDLKNKEKNLENKNTNVVNKETRVMKLQAKESLKEWKEVHDNVQEHGKALRGMLEKALNEKIHDNLDLEIESKTGKGYATPIMVYLNKCQKYRN
jgi:DNA repair exonuclease SbcCD ATPase subunit